MGYGQSCCHRNAHFQQGNFRCRGNGKDQRNQQHKADFIEQRYADNETGQSYSPFYPTAAKHINQRGGNALGTAAFCHELAQHGAERNNNSQAPQGSPQTFFNHGDNLALGQSLGIPDQTSNQQQGQKTVKPYLHNQEKQKENTNCQNNKRHNHRPPLSKLNANFRNFSAIHGGTSLLYRYA